MTGPTCATPAIQPTRTGRCLHNCFRRLRRPACPCQKSRTGWRRCSDGLPCAGMLELLKLLGGFTVGLIPAEIRNLVRGVSRDNPLWGAPRIHGELLKLGIDIAQSTVAKYMPRRHRPPSPGWRAFLCSHTAHMPVLQSRAIARAQEPAGRLSSGDAVRILQLARRRGEIRRRPNGRSQPSPLHRSRPTRGVSREWGDDATRGTIARVDSRLGERECDGCCGCLRPAMMTAA
jgi:hypothetical protein